jgi:hypothetical protein
MWTFLAALAGGLVALLGSVVTIAARAAGERLGRWSGDGLRQTWRSRPRGRARPPRPG